MKHDGVHEAAPSTDFAARLHAAWQSAQSQLCRERTEDGHWIGELSSSALSTATAVTALAIVERELKPRTSNLEPQTSPGLDWLAAHQNPDGGWGDTTKSLSNISTTALCWAAFGAVPGADEKHGATVRAAECWLARRIEASGDSETTRSSPTEGEERDGVRRGFPNQRLVNAIIRRYGKDRTFSVPILTMCALSGRFGAGVEPWRHVLQLPFELAAFPRSWFAALRLPVVSYALPALIAIGHARHFHRPTRNPFFRAIRDRLREKTLRVLEEIQPANGGFLEATPLTSFVVMSLAGGGLAAHPVTKRGVEFLLASQRADGSWAIDTNLATWVTTLSANALGRDYWREHSAEAGQVSQWLRQQQFRSRHSYTNAGPGGWAWTNLPGGVPDADDTAGALLALGNLADGASEADVTVSGGKHPASNIQHPTSNGGHGFPSSAAASDVDEAVVSGTRWLLELQNGDGGIPTFCRGWGALPFDRSSPDLTAHAMRAWGAWFAHLPGAMRSRVVDATGRGVEFLARTQRGDGAWIPLWFGNQVAPDEVNATYGTARTVLALAELLEGAIELPEKTRDRTKLLLGRGVGWLLFAQQESGAWSGSRGGPASIEETAVAVEALAAASGNARRRFPARCLDQSIRRGAEWLMAGIESGAWKQAAPIGFYFARLWYHERLYPQIFTVSALRKVVEQLQFCSRKSYFFL